MRCIIFFIIIIFDLAFRSTILQSFSILSVVPNTTLIFIISYSLLRYEYEGCIFGFIAGILFDLFLSNTIGLFTITATIFGYIASKPFTNLYRESYVSPIITTLVATLVYEILFYFANVFIYGYVSLFVYLYTVIIPVVVYSVIVSPIIFKFVSIVNSLLEERELHKRKVF